MISNIMRITSSITFRSCAWGEREDVKVNWFPTTLVSLIMVFFKWLLPDRLISRGEQRGGGNSRKRERRMKVDSQGLSEGQIGDLVCHRSGHVTAGFLLGQRQLSVSDRWQYERRRVWECWGLVADVICYLQSSSSKVGLSQLKVKAMTFRNTDIKQRKQHITEL